MGYKWSILDANALLRLIIGDIAEQRDAVRDLVIQNEHYYFVPDLVIFECIYVLTGQQYHFCRKDACESLRKVLGYGRLDYNEEVIDPAFELFQKKNKLSFTDCYLKFFAKDRGMSPVWTFDKELVKNGGGFVKEIGLRKNA